MDTRIFHLHALSALHVGVGQAAGVVDLPIMRARASNLPIVPGSALKGVLRDEFADNVKQKCLFGPESVNNNEDAHAGAIALGDAHLLILPVRALAGVVAFVTCPFVLARYAMDLARAGCPSIPVPKVGADACLITEKSVNKADNVKVVLEDLDLTFALGADSNADAWAKVIAERIHAGDDTWQHLFSEHFVIVADDVFSFLADTATEVRARIRINDETGTVARGALWYEENLPAESVLWGVAAFGPARDGSKDDKASVAEAFVSGIGKDKTLQIGGKATVGRGLVRFVI
jgi:CRISPR-associated protein Cmr4